MQFRSQHQAMVEVSRPGITPEDFSVHFNGSSLINDRLGFLISFIDQVLEYNRLLQYGGPTPSVGCYQTLPPSLPLSDPWLCRLCQTSHKDPKTSKGRKWYKGICRPFMELTIEEKLKFLKKEHLCKVCTFSKVKRIIKII